MLPQAQPLQRARGCQPSTSAAPSSAQGEVASQVESEVEVEEEEEEEERDVTQGQIEEYEIIATVSKFTIG